MSSDESMWAPPGDGDESAAPSPLGSGPSLPAAPSQWAPPSPEPETFTPPPPPEPSSGEHDLEPEPPDSLVVGPVEASSATGSTKAGRLIAAVLAVAMIGGGAFLAFGAGSADGGADSPEAAFEQALAAVEAGDLVALAEVMEPAERETVFDAGFAFLDEMVRLEILADDFDASSVDGFDFSLAGADLTVERPRDDLARIYVGAGVLDASIDVADLPLGRRVLEQLTPDQQSYTERQVEVLMPQEMPFVAVERDGRWYLSYWYTAAENLRIEADAPLPDPLDRPAAIGAASPEDAASRFLEEAARLDVARMIGMLDPEEAAALYDYSPLFLDDAAAGANEFLQSAEEAGWSWGFDELEFRAETDGDLATVYLERMTFSAAGDNGSGTLTLADGELAADLTLVDEFWGEETSWSVRAGADGCFEVTIVSGDITDAMDSCDQESAVVTSTPWELQEYGVVARKVDGRWYLSPMRTALDAMVAAVEQVESDDLDALLGPAFFLPGIAIGDAAPIETFGTVDGAIGVDAFEPMLKNGDLLANGLEIEFSYDLDPEAAQWELGFFAPGLDQVEVIRGAYATVDGGLGEVALVVVEVADPTQAGQALSNFVTGLESFEQLSSNGDRIAFSDGFGDPVFVDLEDGVLTLVGVYGAEADAALQVLEQQLAG